MVHVSGSNTDHISSAFSALFPGVSTLYCTVNIAVHYRWKKCSVLVHILVQKLHCFLYVQNGQAYPRIPVQKKHWKCIPCRCHIGNLNLNPTMCFLSPKRLCKITLQCFHDITRVFCHDACFFCNEVIFKQTSKYTQGCVQNALIPNIDSWQQRANCCIYSRINMISFNSILYDYPFNSLWSNAIS